MSMPSELSQSRQREKSVWLREERPLEMPPGFEDVTAQTDDIPERTPSNVGRSASAICRSASSMSSSSKLLMTLAIVNFMPLVSGWGRKYKHLNRYPVKSKRGICGYAMPVELAWRTDRGRALNNRFFYHTHTKPEEGFGYLEFALVYDESGEGKGPLIPLDRFLVVNEDGRYHNGFCVRTKINEFLKSYTDETICPGGWLDASYLQGACSMEQGAEPCMPGRNVSAWIVTPGDKDCPENHLEDKKKIMDKRIADGEFDLMEASAYELYDIIMLANDKKSWSYEYARNMGSSQDFAEKLSLASLNYWARRVEAEANVRQDFWVWFQGLFGDYVFLMYMAAAALVLLILAAVIGLIWKMHSFYLTGKSRRPRDPVPERLATDDFFIE